MKTNLRLMVLLLLGALSIYGAGCSRSNDKSVEAAGEPNRIDATTLIQADKDFLTDAERDHFTEQTAARLAMTKTRNDDIKDYADMIERDHAGALVVTVDLMKEYNLTQPSDLADVSHHAASKLETLNGLAFDQEFMNMMMMDHQKAIQQFQAQSAAAQNDDVRDYAKEMLPTLQKHLDKATEVQNKMNGVKKTTAR